MKTENLSTCPSCGFKVFSEPIGSYEICPICNWEDDLVQTENPDLKGGANKLSLKESQQESIEKIPLNIKVFKSFHRDPEWRPLTKTHRIKILGVPFDHVTKVEALRMVLSHLEKGQASPHKPFFIATPNPEMLLEADKNEAFKKILQQTDLNIADGIGILLASKVLKTPLPERVTGVDLMRAICAQSTKGTKIFLLGAKEGVAETAKQKLESEIPSIQIVGTYSGSPSLNHEQKICTIIDASGAEILFVAFGAPKQEFWLNKNLPNLPHIKIAMGVGGAFDFIAGIRKRAPHWMQKIWLEWLYRLIQEPSRIKRIFNATVRFPIKFISSK